MKDQPIQLGPVDLERARICAASALLAIHSELQLLGVSTTINVEGDALAIPLHNERMGQLSLRATYERGWGRLMLEAPFGNVGLLSPAGLRCVGRFPYETNLEAFWPNWARITALKVKTTYDALNAEVSRVTTEKHEEARCYQELEARYDVDDLRERFGIDVEGVRRMGDTVVCSVTFKGELDLLQISELIEVILKKI